MSDGLRAPQHQQLFAVEIGADMLVIHHPLLLRGVESVAADTPKGKVIHTLIRGGVALFAAHTNADSARPGVNDKLAELVGITPGRPIVPKDPKIIDKWGMHVPADSIKKCSWLKKHNKKQKPLSIVTMRI